MELVVSSGTPSVLVVPRTSPPSGNKAAGSHDGTVNGLARPRLTPGEVEAWPDTT